MGGFGSGRYIRLVSRSKYSVADKNVLRLDIRELYKDDFVQGEARGSITWLQQGKPVASIGTRFDPCRLALVLDYEFGIPPVPVKERVYLTYTACNYGGDRPWFVCPSCGRRCAVLWGKGRFLCRLCQRVAYASQNESGSSRAIRRVHEIRAKLRVEGCVPVWSIPKPRYMRYDRYHALILELARHETVWSGYIMNLHASLEPFEDDMDYWAADHRRWRAAG